MKLYSWIRGLLIIKGGEWVLSRTACLGNDVIDQSSIRNIYRWNIQKGRADILAANLERKKHIKTELPSQIFNASSLWKISSQIIETRWMRFRKPKLVIMDSFSELTDQKFTLKDFSFLAHFSDINWESELSESIQKHGLLPENQIYIEYKRLFELLTAKWGSIAIVYIHFPSKFEQRTEFVNRAIVLKMILNDLKYEYSNLEVIEIPDNLVELHPDERTKEQPFPYHFSDNSKDYVTEKLNEAIAKI